MTRRAFLKRAAALAAASFASPFAAALPWRRRFESDPFTLGVASGAPRPDGVVLWTRLAPDPLAGGGIGDERCAVEWEVAADESFRRIVRKGSFEATPDRAHAVHAEVEGLEPARVYHYRFRAGDARSPVGRTRTAPAPGRGYERLRLALGSCQQYEQGFFGAHRHLAAEDVDLVAFVGDYIYESSWGSAHVRKHSAGVPRTLLDYRNRHAQYRSDTDLQKAHACAPWVVTWDDHEVENDYANDRSEVLDPDFLARRAAAYRAYFEHMPLRPSVLLEGGAMRIYDRHAWGELALLHVLDDRQYRSYQVCARPDRGGSAIVGPECTERLAPRLTLLGAAQERWLEEGLAQSKARWNVIVQQTLFAESGHPNAKGERVHWTDGWDGYPAARERLLESLVAARAANPVFLGGDVHCNYVADIRVNAGDSSAPIVATEFCGTSITSQGFNPNTVRAIKEANPDIHFADSTRRGYVVLDFARESLTARLRVVDSVKRPDMAISTLATYAVEAGRPGIAS